MTTQTQQQAPASWPGSLPEFIVHQELERQGKISGVDFIYQSSRMGGRMQKGGVILDFLFSNPPDLAINVQGVYYHYEFGTGTKARDLIALQQLAGEGITLIFIDEDDALSNARYIVREALAYRDHSRISRGA